MTTFFQDFWIIYCKNLSANKKNSSPLPSWFLILVKMQVIYIIYAYSETRRNVNLLFYVHIEFIEGITLYCKLLLYGFEKNAYTLY